MGSTRRRGRGGGEPAGVLRGNESKEGERRLTGGTGSSARHDGREESTDDAAGPACWASAEREQAARGKRAELGCSGQIQERERGENKTPFLFS